ncbi:S-adenosyl-L-methionine-dependent methyltransferase [Sodiomyces alkalinus F11]|uniref:S-adenosyl-L-methionine-dependent methyltransferase n=1 Tax=Sodiomyces alkalinus (strain CBS 110278 / VKM F-3762 / F11) TaxID=1314773 RepID=A0A3N2Q755_SODAK|nr:S-adenosyl-L-methionine-dependent methyltransferase [Sodiomyces alkalinus F11]ROT42580.1 S-adenosyl-L-methionine-dependent methyltransferase [Sodiomyces alkalinus F11]
MADNLSTTTSAPITDTVQTEQDVTHDNHDDDVDSAYDTSSLASFAMTIPSAIMRHRMENGRRYHAYKEGVYHLPNDEPESERLDIQHHMFQLTFDGKLQLCPVKEQKQLNRVLDCGTGTGIWAIDFADEHPETQVIGVDLSPIQPSFVPPNVHFFIDDLEENWTFTTKFDFIHCRMMTGAIANWPRFFEHCYENLTPGGFIEVTDIVFPVASDDNTIPPDSDFRRWSDLLLESAARVGRPIDSADHYPTQLAEAGFVNIVKKRFKWPQNPWPRSSKYRELGAWTTENITKGVSGLSMALFTRALGWSVDQVDTFLTSVKRDMASPHIHAYYNIHVIYANKPA